MAVSGFETGYKSLDSHVKQMYCKKKKIEEVFKPINEDYKELQITTYRYLTIVFTLYLYKQINKANRH